VNVVMGTPPAPLRVLLVDDDWDARNIYTQYLAHKGMVVETAVDGVDALERAAAFGPDVIVMDISMPLMEGHAAAEALRADPATADIPIIAFSAQGLLKRSKTRVKAFDAVCWKPCRPEELLAVIETVAGDGSAAAAARAAKTPPLR
jgi:two-component system, OmpR family, response regulator MprA